MPNNLKYSHFLIRLTAKFVDDGLFWLLFLLIVNRIINDQSLTAFLSSFATVVAVCLLPAVLVRPLLYDAFLTSKLGGSLGKLLCGIRVTNEEGKYLDYKKSFFRATVGYAFSSVFFGLGFLSILKDQKRQGWHDRAIGSFVTTQKTLWPLGLITTIVLLAINFSLFFSSLDRIFNGKVREDTVKLLEDYQRYSKEKEATPPGELRPTQQQSTPSSFTI